MFFKYFFRRTLNKSSGQDNQSKAFKEAINPHIEERKHPLPCLTDVFPEVLILVNQSRQGCYRLYVSFISYSSF